jgi:hypothetical protein
MMAHDITALDDLQAEAFNLSQAYKALASVTTDPCTKMRLYGCAAALACVAHATGEQSNILLERSVS